MIDRTEWRRGEGPKNWPIPGYRHIVTSVRGAVRALEAGHADAELDLDHEFCFEVPAQPVHKATPALGAADHAQSKDLAPGQVCERGAGHSSCRIAKKELASKVLEKIGTIKSRQASVVSTGAVEKPRKRRVHNYDDLELLLIQPNPIQTPRNSAANLHEPKL